MTRVFNPALIIDPAHIKTTVSAINYDPLDHLDTILPNDKLRARVVSSLAWYTDVLITGEARGLFYKLYEIAQTEGLSIEAGTSVNNYNDFLKLMQSKEQQEANLVEQGFMEGSGVQTLRKLLLLRQTYHDAAVGLSNRHRAPTIEELLANERPMKITTLTKDKLRALAKHMSDDDNDKETMLFDELVKRENQRAADMHKRRMEIAPILTSMISFIEHTGTDDVAELSDLPVDMRKRLIENIAKSIDRSVSELASDRSTNAIEYCSVLIEGKAARQAVERVLAHPIFNDPSELLSDTSLRHERARVDNKVDVGPQDPTGRDLALKMSSGKTAAELTP